MLQRSVRTRYPVASSGGKAPKETRLLHAADPWHERLRIGQHAWKRRRALPSGTADKPAARLGHEPRRLERREPLLAGEAVAGLRAPGHQAAHAV